MQKDLFILKTNTSEINETKLPILCNRNEIQFKTGHY